MSLCVLRLVVSQAADCGGRMDRVYELNRNFRNEGIDRTHNPEFTCLEIYQAYGDMRSMQELIQGIFAHVAETVYGKMEFEWMGHTINLKGLGEK